MLKRPDSDSQGWESIGGFLERAIERSDGGGTGFDLEPMASPGDGARKINARIAFFYPYTGITPAMCMLLPGMGSQYLMAMRDSHGDYFDGGGSNRLNLPPDIPQSRFWSVMVYDRQTRSMLQTDQPKPDVGSQSGTLETNSNGSTDVYFAPSAPGGKADYWLQRVPGKGFFTILRPHNPLPAFFDKSWRPSEIEPMRAVRPSPTDR